MLDSCIATSPSCKLGTVLLQFVLALLLASSLCAGESQLMYVKRDTREETRRASIEATRKAVPALRQSPWHALGRTPGRDLAKASPNGALDLSAEVTGVDGKATHWTDASRYSDGNWHVLQGQIGWLYRTVVASEPQDATLIMGVDGFIKVYLNGVDVQSFTTTLSMADRKSEFTVQLNAGTNHMLILVGSTPLNFFYDLSPVRAAQIAELERKLDSDFPTVSENHYYKLETVPVPKDIVLEVGGLTFSRDGALMIATRRGDIWAVKDGQWSLFASGLHEPLGIIPGERGEFFVMQRPELTRISDPDGDGRATVFSTVTSFWEISGNHHEYIYGPVRDSKGNLWGVISGLGDAGRAKYLGWCFKVTPSGDFELVASGFRSSNGIVVTPDDEVFIADNQGEYVGTSPLHHVTPGAFHGHPVSLRWDKNFKGDPFKAPIEELDKLRKKPAILFPYGPMGHSLSQPIIDTTAGKFGLFAGQMFIGDQSKCTVMRVALEKVHGEFQGACFPFRRGFQSGNNRLVFAPDGSLYVGQTDRGWGAIGGRPWGLQRLIWTGEVPMEIQTMRLLTNGFELTFTKPVDRASVTDATAFSVQHYRYRYHATYGSPVIDNVTTQVSSVHADGNRVSLTLPELVTGKIYELNIRGLRATDGAELLHPTAYYTLNQLR